MGYLRIIFEKEFVVEIYGNPSSVASECSLQDFLVRWGPVGLVSLPRLVARHFFPQTNTGCNNGTHAIRNKTYQCQTSESS